MPLRSLPLATPAPVAQRTFDTYTAEVNKLQAHYASIISALDHEYVRVTNGITDALARALEAAGRAREDMEAPTRAAYAAGMDAAERAYNAIAGPAQDVHDTMAAQARQSYDDRMGPVQRQLTDDLDTIKAAYENLTMTAPPTP